MTFSPVLECHGLKWKVLNYPGGSNTSNGDEAYVSLLLESESCSSTKKIKARSIMRIPPAGYGHDLAWRTYAPRNDDAKESEAWGPMHCARRSDVLDPSKNYLVGGNLTVEVDIQVMLDKPPTWTPTNTVCSDMLKLLESADDDGNADVLFEVGVGDKAKTRSKQDGRNVFHAHKAILSIRSPTLASLAEDCSPGTPIPITDVHPDIFRMLLRFVYGGEVPDQIALAENSKSIIRAADRFGCTGLKLAAEAQLASVGITTVNAAELILFADGTNCALLKEAAMEYFVANAQDVMASEGFDQVKESPAVMAELLAVGFGGSTKRPASADENAQRDYKRMRVATLRRKLDEKELDVDGSKEMLVSRLEAADAEDQADAQGEAETGEDSSDIEDSDEDEDSDDEEDSDDDV